MTSLRCRAVMLEPLVRAALLEDLGRAGDLTTDAVVPADRQADDGARGAPAGRDRRARPRRASRSG